MHLSVIVPLYNCLSLTQAMVASLQATLPAGLSHEIILVDDGSTDGTRAWLATLRAPFVVVLNPHNLGYAGANNRGAARARGEYLALLNNDLVLTPGWLEPMLAAHRRLGLQAGMVGNVQRQVHTGAIDHAGIVIDAKGKPAHLRERSWRALPCFRSPLRPVPAVTGACALISRPLWESLGGFEERYRNGCEDVDLCLRLQAEGRVNVVALRSVVWHHVSASPGRKLRDEENTRLLVLRWRHQLVRLGARAWCAAYLQAAWSGPSAAGDHRQAAACLAYLARLRTQPPAFALAGLDAAIERELDRWQGLLGEPSLHH